MASQQSSGGANNSVEGHSYAHDSFVSPWPAPPIYFTARPEPTASVVEPAGNNISAAAQLPPSSNKATAAAAAAAARTDITTTVTTNAPPRRLSVMHQTLWALKLKQDAKDPEAAARARAHRIEMRKFRENYDAWIKAEVERLDAEAAAAKTDDTKTVTASAPPKRLSVMHQTLWAFKQKRDAKDPEAAARARAARIERRKRQEEWDAEVKAAEERFEASKAAGDATTDAADAGASHSSTETRALPAFFYDEHE
ncbi:hypothetical protein LQW54_007636 [Pestalotiopsis sp. IQ-011]